MLSITYQYEINFCIRTSDLVLYMCEQFDLLEVLHPTPAVCGHPQAPAREAITASGMIFFCLTAVLIQKKNSRFFWPTDATLNFGRI